MALSVYTHEKETQSCWIICGQAASASATSVWSTSNCFTSLALLLLSSMLWAARHNTRIGSFYSLYYWTRTLFILCPWQCTGVIKCEEQKRFFEFDPHAISEHETVMLDSISVNHDSAVFKWRGLHMIHDDIPSWKIILSTPTLVTTESDVFSTTVLESRVTYRRLALARQHACQALDTQKTWNIRKLNNTTWFIF